MYDHEMTQKTLEKGKNIDNMYIFGGVHIMAATIYSRSHKNVIEWE